MSKKLRIGIIGAGRIGQALAPMLEAQGLSVKIIDKDRKRCETMTQKLRKGLVLAGDGTDMDLLTAEGIGEADTVICLTKDERLNMMMVIRQSALWVMVRKRIPTWYMAGCRIF